jgi:hypothetical protein
MGGVQFNTIGPRTIALTVTDTVKDQAQTPIPLSGHNSISLMVNDLPAGVYVSNVIPPINVDGYNGNAFNPLCTTTPSCNFISVFEVPLEDMSSNCGPLGCIGNPGPGALTVVGTISKATGPTSTTWTVTDTTTNTTTMPPPLMNDPSNPSTLMWTPPDLTHTYAITMTTTVGGAPYGTSTITVQFVTVSLPH